MFCGQPGRPLLPPPRPLFVLERGWREIRGPVAELPRTPFAAGNGLRRGTGGEGTSSQPADQAAQNSVPDPLPLALALLLAEKLGGCKLNVAEVTQSEIGQKQKLHTVLEAVQDLLRPHGWAPQWAVDGEQWGRGVPLLLWDRRLGEGKASVPTRRNSQLRPRSQPPVSVPIPPKLRAQ